MWASILKKFPDTTDELLNNTYVDDVQSGGDHSDKFIKFKEESTKIMDGGGFHLHKWHSNLPEIEERELKMMQCPLKQVRLMPS